MNFKQLKPQTLAAFRAADAKLRSMQQATAPQLAALTTQKSRSKGRTFRNIRGLRR